MNEEVEEVSTAAIDRMLQILPVIQANRFKPFGVTVNEPGKWPHMHENKIVEQFIDMIYEDNWFYSNYNWPSHATEMVQSLADDNFYSNASLDDIRKAFRYAVRSDRFCGGNLINLFDSGAIEKLLIRLATIHGVDVKTKGETNITSCVTL